MNNKQMPWWVWLMGVNCGFLCLYTPFDRTPAWMQITFGMVLILWGLFGALYNLYEQRIFPAVAARKTRNVS